MATTPPRDVRMTIGMERRLRDAVEAAAEAAGVETGDFVRAVLAEAVKPRPTFTVVCDLPVTVLEPHGLSVRAIGILEDQLGVCYLRQLQELLDRDEKALTRCPLGGPALVAEVHAALRSYHAVPDPIASEEE